MAIDKSLFVPYCSDRERIFSGLDRYSYGWDRGKQTIDDVLYALDNGNADIDMSGYSKKRFKVYPYHVGLTQDIFRDMVSSADLDYTDDMELILLARATASKMQRIVRSNGSGPYYSLDLIISFLGIDPVSVRMRMNMHAAHVMSFFDKGLELINENTDMPGDHVLNGLDLSSGILDLPLCGINEFSRFGEIKKDEFLELCRGFILFSYADNYENRISAMKRFFLNLDGKTRFRIGYGANLPFSMDKFEGTDFFPYDLKIDESTLDYFTDLGYVVKDPRGSTYPEVKNFYIPFYRKSGISDLCGLMMLGEGRTDRLSNMRVVGGVLSDALDSMKDFMYDPFYGNLPFFIGRYVEENIKNITGNEVVSDREKVDFTYLVSVLNHEPIYRSVPHRKFIQGRPTILNRILTGNYDGAEIKFYLRDGFSISPLKDVFWIAMDRYDRFYSDKNSKKVV